MKIEITITIKTTDKTYIGDNELKSRIEYSFTDVTGYDIESLEITKK